MNDQRKSRRAGAWATALAGVAALVAGGWPLQAAQQPGTAALAARPCRLAGFVRHETDGLPGASVTVRDGDRVVAVTSTDVDGTYVAALAPGTYTVEVALAAFVTAHQPVVVGGAPCQATYDADLALVSRTPGATLEPGILEAAPEVAGATAPVTGGRGGRFGGAPRFQSLSVRQAAAATPEATVAEASLDAFLGQDDPAARLLPPGFSPDSVLESVAVSGTMIQLDRGQMNSRVDALGRGDFSLASAEPFVALDQGGGGFAGAFGGGPGGGRGGLGGLGRGGGNRLQMMATYGLGGSMFDSPPYALRNEVTTARDYLQQNFSTTVGGPVRIPGVYDGTNRTTFNFSYSGARNEDAFDQYATVPDTALRAGDFSGTGVAILDPATGQPFVGNQIPADRISPSARSLLQYLPEANLSGETRNYHRSATTRSHTDTFTLRLTHTLTQPQAGRGGGRGGRAGGAGRGGGRAGFAAPLNVTVNGTVTYRRNDGDRPNVFPLLSGSTKGSTLSVPLTLNIRKGRLLHNLSASFSRTTSTSLNDFAFVQDVAGLAGIGGVATDPFDWGVPTLAFGTFTGLRDTAPSRRADHSWRLSYGLTRPAGAHTWRAGASFEQQTNQTQSDSNARGTFTFTGLYTSGGAATVRGGGQDFADFLLGLPQQATRQYSETIDAIVSPVTIRGRSVSAYIQDDWRLHARWTINYGLQYDFTSPYTETNGRMVNLDATPDFTAVAPVRSSGTGPYSGRYPAGLVNADWNNLAPRAGVAWRATNRSVVRFGYGLSYDGGSYSSIARNLYQQPPFFLTGTSLGTLEAPLTLAHAFANIAPDTVTNTYGIDRNYQLGRIQQWNVDYSRDLTRVWNVGVTYIGTRGSRLDMLRAPNRGADGLRIAGVQAFTWQSADGASHMNGLSLRVQKRQSSGVSGSASYTLSRSWDDTTATGGGASVAQDDQNLAAEWGLSNFDRRHQFNGNVRVELPWGRNRRWLSEGGWLATVVGDWSMAATVTLQSGTPLTVRCSTCASDVARGIGGTLRADYNGQAIAVDEPTIDRYFNTAAFSIPQPGLFGNAPRNVVIGPGARDVSAQFTRDVAIGGTRTVSLNVNASNLFNLVNYGSIDTNVNSPTFGQVLSVRGRRTVRVTLRFRF